MPSYQLLRRPVGEGGFLVVAIAASLLPANSLPQGGKKPNKIRNKRLLLTCLLGAPFSVEQR